MKGTPYFVIVPSISEITTRSVESQTKIRAVAATAPEVESEKVIEFAPGRRFRDFWGGIRQYRPKLDAKIELTSWSEVNLKVFANFFIGVGGMAFGVVCISLLGKTIPSTGR